MEPPRFCWPQTCNVYMFHEGVVFSVYGSQAGTAERSGSVSVRSTFPVLNVRVQMPGSRPG